MPPRPPWGPEPRSTAPPARGPGCPGAPANSRAACRCSLAPAGPAPRFHRRAGQQREFAVIADQDRQAAQRGIEHAQRLAPGDEPFLPLEPGHDQLVLRDHGTAGENRRAALRTWPSQSRRGRWRPGYARHGPGPGARAAHRRGQQRGNRVDRSGQIGHRRGIEAGQFHRAIFGKDQQRGAPATAWSTQAVSLAS
jgi:hypothetical protein